MATKIINTDLTEEALEIVNWLFTEPSEIRNWRDGETLLAFMSHYDIQEFFNLMEKNLYEPWVDGTTNIEYNGSDYIVDIKWILHNLDVDTDWFIKTYKESEDE